MAKELYIALNKKNYEGLLSGETNEVIIKKNDWWTKRLMDLDTGVFKDFDVASISCGSADKLNYPIEKIELRGEEFVITVTLTNGEEEKPEDNPGDEVLEENDTYVDTGDSDSDVDETELEPEVPSKPEPKKYFDREEILDDDPNDDVEYNVKDALLKILDTLCKHPDVYNVNMPNVIIRNNGQVFGCNKKLLADKDSDVMFNFNKMVFIQYYGMDDYTFVEQIMNYLENTMKNSYLFINKKACGFSVNNAGELVFKMTLVPKKKYLFLKRR